MIENRIGYGDYGQLSIATITIYSDDPEEIIPEALFYVLWDGSLDLGSMVIRSC